ncbi:single-stranded DNA-binding protein [Geodermatophilus sp. TF02-6]|uniref:single-stranded DNA-binding protein n=1 Tax=Geodermatophilus sp. TF02-6 TaxID=2250575 RepID=UPI000DEBB3AB|nr:single-stranded DNA-binding protein [Geodermatophilus sp. TF02-6]RBY75752.1 single-stranded DNA-binding protein [Geodermatophilus sp. TF02-6]
MNDTYVTVIGNVVDAPRRYSPDGRNPVTNFRMASTARRFDNRTQEFVDGGTFWVDVECWNELSGNVSGSISKGDPVIVYGALTTHSWEGENGRRSVPRIRATAVGPNLNRGTALFKRSRSARPAEEGAVPSPSSAVDDAFAREPGPPVPARDYEGTGEALYETDTADLAAEPARV